MIGSRHCIASLSILPRYDGIYKVKKYWPQKGKSGHIVWRYLLARYPTSSTAFAFKKDSFCLSINVYLCFGIIKPIGMTLLQLHGLLRVSRKWRREDMRRW